MVMETNMMYTKEDLKLQIKNLGIKSNDTLMIHSSMKSIGQVEGGADTVLDAFIEFLADGLLIFPTHTWKRLEDDYTLYQPETEPSCVGLLTNLFLKREGVLRSLHPTHSVAALGKDAEKFIEGEEQFDTPCNRSGCYGKLYDRKAKILFLGCDLNHNTYLHGVEEWNKIPNRLADKYRILNIKMPDGSIKSRPMYCHYSSAGDISEHYGKMEHPFISTGISTKGKFGDAGCIVCDAVGMADLVSEYLKKNPDLFADSFPIPIDWYK